MQMEIEQNNAKGILRRLQISQLNQISAEKILYEAQFQSPQFPDKNLKISVTTKNFIVTQYKSTGQDTGNIFGAKLQFQLKFQALYEADDQPTSMKLGFGLYECNNKQNKFYSPNTVDVEGIINILSHKLNQKGFHQQFKPVKKLGKGNFASVYEVVRITDGSRFAVKAFSKVNTFCSQNGKQSLINELSVLRSLSHSNILHLESVYQSDNSIYVVIELLKGKSLYDVIKQKNGKFNIVQIKKIMHGLLEGLKQMDHKRILHRDLKPENIMMRTNNEDHCPIIIDFGLATPCDIDKYLFYRCGTPGFVAPEIIKTNGHSKTQPVCDMFSIGCIFHILLTGFPIFPGTQYSQVYQKNKNLQFNIKAEKIAQKDSNAMNLLMQMLIDNPIIRIKANDALNHPFFQGMGNQKSQNSQIYLKDHLQVLTTITRQSTRTSNF